MSRLFTVRGIVGDATSGPNQIVERSYGIKPKNNAKGQGPASIERNAPFNDVSAGVVIPPPQAPRAASVVKSAATSACRQGYRNRVTILAQPTQLLSRHRRIVANGDEQTGLVHFGARDYDPTSGRWLEPDPLGFFAGSANLYAYVDNDPINNLDPSGRCPCDEAGGTSGTSRSIGSLDPSIQEQAQSLIDQAADQGIKLIITSTFRSIAQQDAIYQVGRDGPDDKRAKKTNAKGGDSFHNYGMAIDVLEIVGGKERWDLPDKDTFGPIGESLGLRWGHRFKRFDDPYHFESKMSLKDLKKLGPCPNA